MNEYILTSASKDKDVSVHVWDASTGTSLMTYREGGCINKRGLALLGSEHVIAVEKLKPVLRVWSINSQKPLHAPRLLCTGKVSAMAPSHDAAYIAVAVDEKIHIYQVASGSLMGTGVRHFQPVTVIRWCAEGSTLACGGDDGMVTVWNLAGLFARESQPEPEHIFSDHSLPVADVALTSGRSHGRLISVSADRTCKIYELAAGTLLLSVVFNEMLTALAVTLTEMEIFVGGSSGNIYQISLRTPKSIVEYHMSEENLDKADSGKLSGHTEAVTCLSCSQDGVTLLSGSNDETLKIWHMTSRQCLRTIQLKGPATNAFFIRAPKEMFDYDVKKNVILHSFQKTVFSEEDSELCLEISAAHALPTEWSVISDSERMVGRPADPDDADASTDELQREVNNLRSINEKLYKFSVDRLLQKRYDDDDIGLTNDVSNSDKMCNGGGVGVKRKRKKVKK